MENFTPKHLNDLRCILIVYAQNWKTWWKSSLRASLLMPKCVRCFLGTLSCNHKVCASGMALEVVNRKPVFLLLYLMWHCQSEASVNCTVLICRSAGVAFTVSVTAQSGTSRQLGASCLQECWKQWVSAELFSNLMWIILRWCNFVVTAIWNNLSYLYVCSISYVQHFQDEHIQMYIDLYKFNKWAFKNTSKGIFTYTYLFLFKCNQYYIVIIHV